MWNLHVVSWLAVLHMGFYAHGNFTLVLEGSGFDPVCTRRSRSKYSICCVSSKAHMPVSLAEGALPFSSLTMSTTVLLLFVASRAAAFVSSPIVMLLRVDPAFLEQIAAYVLHV